MAKSKGRMTHEQRQAYQQRLMASLRGEGVPLTITEAGEVVEGETLPRPGGETLEEIAYALDLYAWMLDEPARVVIQAVWQIPDEVRAFVYQQCLFVQGWFRIIRPTSPFYTIILPETFGDEAGDDSMVAHYIAKAFLQHQENMAMDAWTLADDVRAAELARAWGFTGDGANVEQYRLDAEQYGPTTRVL